MLRYETPFLFGEREGWKEGKEGGRGVVLSNLFLPMMRSSEPPQENAANATRIQAKPLQHDHITRVYYRWILAALPVCFSLPLYTHLYGPRHKQHVTHASSNYRREHAVFAVI